MDFLGLARVQDVEKESQYGFVYGVSGPGECNNDVSCIELTVGVMYKITSLTELETTCIHHAITCL